MSLILNLVANGLTAKEIVKAYSYVEHKDITQCLRYAVWKVKSILIIDGRMLKDYELADSIFSKIRQKIDKHRFDPLDYMA